MAIGIPTTTHWPVRRTLFPKWPMTNKAIRCRWRERALWERRLRQGSIAATPTTAGANPVAGAIVGGAIGGLIGGALGHGRGAVAGVAIGATTGAVVAAEAQPRPGGYFWWRGACYYRYPNGAWSSPMAPNYCGY